MNRRHPNQETIERALAGAPEGTGVYIIRDREGGYLYVGKSLAVRKRLRDHWQAARQGVEKEALMMGGLGSAEFFVTGSELEALILENSLIKRHRPRYNVILRDDKTYPYLRLDVDAPFPRLTVVRRPREDGALYAGPYVSVAAMRRTLRHVGALFPLRKCRDENLRPRRRPCLNAGIGRCLGPCAGGVSREGYREVVEEVALFLKGRHLKLRRRMEHRMEEAARQLRFEEAARLRDRLREMGQFFEHQAMYGGPLPSADVIGLAQGMEGWTAYVILIRSGSVIGGEAHRLAVDRAVGEGEVLQEFLERFYGSRDDVPARVVVPVSVPGRSLLEEFLGSRRGKRVRITVPSRGRGLELLLLARRNALGEQARGKRRPTAPASPFWENLGLGGVPERIEVFDASSTGGSEAVVGMALWEGGAFRKDAYRRFLVRSAPGSDDYAMIREALRRRLARVGRGEEPEADLIVVDGGEGHVTTAAGELRRAGSRAGLVGISKGARRSQGDRLHLADGSIPKCAPDDPVLRFLGGLRDEVHRYAVGYHRKRRGAAATRSILDGIRGLGPRRKAILVGHFGDPRAVARATLDDLMAVPGVPEAVARAVYGRLHGGGLAGTEG